MHPCTDARISRVALPIRERATESAPSARTAGVPLLLSKCADGETLANGENAVKGFLALEVRVTRVRHSPAADRVPGVPRVPEWAG
jgi:hypothetical protein